MCVVGRRGAERKMDEDRSGREKTEKTKLIFHSGEESASVGPVQGWGVASNSSVVKPKDQDQCGGPRKTFPTANRGERRGDGGEVSQPPQSSARFHSAPQIIFQT